MVKCLKDTGFRWPKKPPNASEVKFNSTYKKLTFQWLDEALCFVSSSLLADSFVLHNRQLLVAAKRCSTF